MPDVLEACVCFKYFLSRIILILLLKLLQWQERKKMILILQTGYCKQYQKICHTQEICISILAVCKEQHSVIEFVHTVSTLSIFTSWNYYMKIIKEKETNQGLPHPWIRTHHH